MDDSQAKKFFQEYFEPARRHNEAAASRWREYEAAYLGDPGVPKPEGEDAWRSFLFLKYAFQQIQTLAAELASEDDPTFVYEPRNQAQDAYASLVSSIVSYQLQRDRYSDKRLLAAIGAAVYGGQPLKTHWDFRESKRRVLLPDGTRGEKIIVTKDQPTIEIVPVDDFFYDTRATSTDNWRYVFHRTRQTLEELKSVKRADGSPMFTNLDQLEKYQGNVSVGESSSEVFDTLENDDAGEREKARREGIEVIEMWTRERVIVRAAGCIIIRNDPNPFMHGKIPFDVATILPNADDVWGKSLIWAIRDVQEFLWTIDNAGNDALKMTITPPVVVDARNPSNAERPIRPGQVYLGDGTSVPVSVLNITGAQPYVSESASQAIAEKMKQITGITNEMAGVSDAKTATEAAINQRQSKGRVGIMLRALDSAFARCADMFLQLNQQFLDFTQPVRVNGPRGAEWRRIPPQAISGMWDVRSRNSSERVVVELHRQNLMEGLAAMQGAQGIVTPSGRVVDTTPILEELADSFRLPRERVVVPVEMMFEQQAKQADFDIAQQQKATAAMPAEEAAMPEMPAAMPEQPDDLNEQLRITYKDLDPKAQVSVLEKVGLDPSGVIEQEDRDTREQEAKIAKLEADGSIGLSSGQKSRYDNVGK